MWSHENDEDYYGKFISALSESINGEDIVGTLYSRDRDIDEVIKRTISRVPFTSEIYLKVLKCYSKYATHLYHTEHVLVTKRYPYDVVDIVSNMEDYQFSWELRANTEWNPYYLQFVVGTIVELRDPKKSKFVLLKPIKGPFRGKSTLIQGHVSFTNNASNFGDLRRVFEGYRNFDVDTYHDVLHEFNLSQMDFQNIMKANMVRELNEEILLTDESNLTIKILPSNLDNMKIKQNEIDSMSALEFYHEGVFFDTLIEVPDVDTIQVQSGEIFKHEVNLLTESELRELKNSGDCDSWLKDYLNRFSLLS